MHGRSIDSIDTGRWDGLVPVLVQPQIPDALYLFRQSIWFIDRCQGTQAVNGNLNK